MIHHENSPHYDRTVKAGISTRWPLILGVPKPGNIQAYEAESRFISHAL
jgi:hypothetical protein